MPLSRRLILFPMLCGFPDVYKRQQYLNQVIVPKMEELRAVIDAIEEAVSSDNYPFPTYDDMFISMQ